jgi:hypothetical protein
MAADLSRSCLRMHPPDTAPAPTRACASRPAPAANVPTAADPLTTDAAHPVCGRSGRAATGLVPDSALSAGDPGVARRSSTRVAAQASSATFGCATRMSGKIGHMPPEAVLLFDRPLASVPPAPRWARMAAHTVPLVALPSTLWRLALVVGIPVGYSDAMRRSDYDIPGSGYLVLPLICLFQEAAALLTVGLVSNWGLVVPRWIPLLGSKRVATWAAVVPASPGALVLTVVAFSRLLIWDRLADQGHLTGAHRAVLGWCYAPLLLWGPLLALVTVSYWLRRRQ